MKEWYMDYDLLAVMVGVGIITVSLQCIGGWLIGELYRNSSYMNATENPWLKKVISRFEAGYQLMVPVNDVSVFVDRNIAEYRFLNLGLEQWRDMGIYGAWVECILMGISTLIALYYQTELHIFGMYVIYMVLILSLIMGCEFVLQSHNHQKRMRLYMLDYFENILRPRLENHYLHPEREKAYQRAYFAEKQVSATQEENMEEQRNSQEQENIEKLSLSRTEQAKLLSEVIDEYF